MLGDFCGKYGFRLSWLDSTNKVDVKRIEDLKQYVADLCSSYRVNCRIFSRRKTYGMPELEYYIVFSIHSISDDLKFKQLYIRNQRSEWLFYTDYHIVKFTEHDDFLSLLNSAHSYCKTVDFLRNIFKEYKTPLPKVIHGTEITGLKEYNLGKLNGNLPENARATYDRGLEKFFKQERTRSKYLQKWRAFSRTDKYDRKASTVKMFWDFYHRDEQFVSLDLLRESNSHLKTIVINEHEFKKFKKELPQRDSGVLCSVTKVEIENGGFAKRNRRKPVGKMKSGPFGRLVTYEDYCKVVEQKFVSEGYDAIMDLAPTLYETRQLTYKEIDEPIIASILNAIRFAYAKSSILNKVVLPGTDLVYIIDIPVDLMMNFVSLATANKIEYHIDFIGRFSTPNFEKLCIAYNPMHYDMMCSISERLIEEKFEYDKISTNLLENGLGINVIKK